ncbi:cation:proton antiporter [Oceanibacterium hippocampi]|uniref:Glutathione-regulated potassium-efflux system protein KefC n=1 Tax=Oceanibacterium hippocampi TaxID=745714 RepID=A0A1Y5RYA8_9PROT|nr:cation:proton antiporter [Oceanibacterium hippocampi]SLN28391.1 Glutathione-regulated potassium-efflux system protein KefC [Oceanibacterium hippocampi]
MHFLSEIALIALVALLLGLVMTRMRQPSLVGYILAGVVLGIFMPRISENREVISLLAELGVLMLLFLIGMELSLRSFMRVWRVSVITMVLQVALSLAVMWLLSYALGWPGELAILLGFAIALSSTAVAIKILEDVGELRSDVGQVAVGVLVAQDLAVVPMLLIVSSLGGGGSGIVGSAAMILLAVGLLVALVVLLSRRQSVRLPFGEWLGDHHDLTPMTGLALCFGAAALSGVLGLTPSYGAFLAGLVLGNTRERKGMMEAMMPIQAVLMMVFFLSVGLLVDIPFVIENIGTVLLLLAIVTVVKTVANVCILRLTGEPWPRSFKAGTVLGQIGEFSFVLMAAGATAGIVDDYARRLMVSLIVFSLAVSPLWLLTSRRLEEVRWRRIANFRHLWAQLYGRETQAVVSVSSRAVASTARITLAFRGQTGPAADDDDRDPAADEAVIIDVDAEAGAGRPDVADDGPDAAMPVAKPAPKKRKLVRKRKPAAAEAAVPAPVRKQVKRSKPAPSAQAKKPAAALPAARTTSEPEKKSATPDKPASGEFDADD